MNKMPFWSALCFLVLGMLVVVAAGEASSADEWEAYQREVESKCAKACGMKKAKVMGEMVLFDDAQVGFDAVMIRGRYPQPQMKNAEGYGLCLFNKKTRQAECGEADQWFQTGR